MVVFSDKGVEVLIMKFTREELQEIRMKAEEAADVYRGDTSWRRAYLRLVDAATTLDAFMARKEEKTLPTYMKTRSKK